jgi:hypothetical protein
LTGTEPIEQPSFQSREVGVGQYLTAAGNPLRMSFAMLPRFSASFARGVGHIGFKKSLGGRPPERCATAFVLLASGVGNNPDAVAAVMGTNGGSRYAVPFRIIPERGQVSENVSKPSTKQSCDVFHEDVSRSNFANNSGVLSPQPAALAGKSSALSRKANVLAGEAAADNVNGNSVCCQSFGGEASHVVINRHLRPMLSQNAAAKGFDFAERYGFESARALKPQAETADAAKQVKHAHHSSSLKSSRWTVKRS